MEKRFKKFNLINIIAIVVLSIWCALDAVLIDNVNSFMLPILFCIFLFCNLFYAFFAWQIAVNKKYYLLTNFKEESEYNFEIFDYNMFSCNGIIALATVGGQAIMLLTYAIMAGTKNVENIPLALGIIFALSSLSWLIPVMLKDRQITNYMKETNRICEV